ncbi:fatty acid desaturase family protein [Archangium sp.]|uniref:fatty acid desaturase family protein n=1 Tax=Archangium sp. TaxID=1872627 RepID=UPI002D2F8E1C|nr:fatty acid desaturase [Archangium sp.]HYO52968.1 fatty acid desaturase [Archangium sp.]
MESIGIESVPRYKAFAREIEELGREMGRNTGWEDFQHLRRIERGARLCTLLGYLTAWLFPNPLSAFLLAQGLIGRLLIGHHIGHGGYDRIAGIPERYTSRGFARGWRRYLDWFDWWGHRSWLHLHNKLHHSYTQDPLDADLLDPENFQHLRLPSRYGMLLGFALTWKFSYYAPYMQRELLNHEGKVKRLTPYRYHPRDLYDLTDPIVRRLWLHHLLPYMGFHFVLVPLLFLPLGSWAVLSVLCNTLLGELLSNLQGFISIRSTHSAQDIPLFTPTVSGRTDYIVRQVLGTANYRTGGDVLAFLHVWTNYQVEHHLWPRSTMLKYRQYQPRVKALCERYGIRYLQDSVWKRFLEMSRIYVGLARQPLLDTSALQAKTFHPLPAAPKEGQPHVA